jgi:prophage regulatory protein
MQTIMKRQEVCAVTGLCYTSIYNKEKVGEFPSRRKLGARSVGWIRQEVEDWINDLQRVANTVKV